MHTRHLAGLLIALWLLSGCAVPASMPPFLALITPIIPGIPGGCSGAVVGPREVLTAKHCVDTAARVVTVYGQEAWVVDARLSPAHDVAILIVDRVLFVDKYAEFANPALNEPAYLFGYCPYQVSHVPRHAFYNGLVDVEIQGNPLATYGEWILPTLPSTANEVCGGDSGTSVLQNGKVVGILSGGHIRVFFIPLASTAYTVPVEHAWELLEVEE